MSSPSLARWIPALTWLRSYNRSWLRSDILAGITLAAYLLPAALGDASLANLPPEAGLYACLFGGLVFWAFCGSRYTALSVTSAISLVIGTSLGEMTDGNTMRFSALAAGTALLVHRLHCVAREGRSHGEFHFGERHSRIQVRRSAFPCQHTVAEAVRFSWRTWELLGKRGLLLQAPRRDELDLASGWRNRAGVPHHWKSFPQAQARCSLRRNRRYCCRIGAFLRGARRETHWHRAAGITPAPTACRLLA